MAERKATDGKRLQKLIVWQKDHILVQLGNKFSDRFSQNKIFGLTNQLHRAMVSVPANIAEGYASGDQGQFKCFLNITQGSLADVEYFLILLRDLKNISSENIRKRSCYVKRWVISLTALSLYLEIVHD